MLLHGSWARAVRQFMRRVACGVRPATGKRGSRSAVRAEKCVVCGAKNRCKPDTCLLTRNAPGAPHAPILTSRVTQEQAEIACTEGGPSQPTSRGVETPPPRR